MRPLPERQTLPPATMGAPRSPTLSAVSRSGTKVPRLARSRSFRLLASLRERNLSWMLEPAPAGTTSLRGIHAHSTLSGIHVIGLWTTCCPPARAGTVTPPPAKAAFSSFKRRSLSGLRRDTSAGSPPAASGTPVDASAPPDGNPTTVACITDGNWVLKVAAINHSTALVGLQSKRVVSGEGILDLREPTIDGKVYTLRLGPWAGGYAFQDGSTITEFYADNVAYLGSAGTFIRCKGLTTVSISGTFDTVGGSCFNLCTALTNVVLNSTALKAIGGSAFQESKKLTAIEITSDLALTVNNTAVQYNSPLTSLTINGPVWETTNVDNILAKNEASTAAKKCTIYANKDTWSSLAAELTDAETAVKPKKCFGVYREGSRKAWLVANNADPVPFRIIIR